MKCPKGKHRVRSHNRKGGVRIKSYCAKNPRRRGRAKRGRSKRR